MALHTFYSRQRQTRRAQEIGMNDPKNEKQGWIYIKTYEETVNYLLHAYGTDDSLSRAHSEITHIKEVPQQHPLAFARAILSKSYRFGLVYYKTAITHTLIWGINDYIYNQIRRFYTMYR